MSLTLDDTWYIRHSAGQRGIDLPVGSAEAFIREHGEELERRLFQLRQATADHERWLTDILEQWTAAAKNEKGTPR